MNINVLQKDEQDDGHNPFGDSKQTGHIFHGVECQYFAHEDPRDPADEVTMRVNGGLFD